MKKILILTIIFSIFFLVSYGRECIDLPETESPIIYTLKSKKSNTDILPTYRDIPLKYFKYFYKYSVEYDVPMEVLSAIAWRESNFNIHVVSKHENSPYADEGMFQINSQYKKEFEYRYFSNQELDPFNLEHSLEFASKHLADLYKSLGQWHKAIAAYNCGLTRVQNNDIPELTALYLMKVYPIVEQD